LILLAANAPKSAAAVPETGNSMNRSFQPSWILRPDFALPRDRPAKPLEIELFRHLTSGPKQADLDGLTRFPKSLAISFMGWLSP